MGFSLVIGFLESLTSYYLVVLLLVTGLILRFRYYVLTRTESWTAMPLLPKEAAM